MPSEMRFFLNLCPKVDFNKMVLLEIRKINTLLTMAPAKAVISIRSWRCCFFCLQGYPIIIKI